MKQTLRFLEWDSEFFNYNVSKIEGQLISEFDVKNVECLIKENNIELSYYSTSKELSYDILKKANFDIVCVDKKITYTKDINSDLEIDKSIISVDHNTYCKEKLIDLGIQSGIYSRFNIDKRIGKEKFEEMYGLWIFNSLNRKIAKDVLGFKENDKLCGFITLGEKNNRADIGMIAVDHSSRGKGIGKKLMSTAERRFADLGYTSIQVVTQGDNKPACRLYESCGYKVDEVKFYYHIWKKNLKFMVVK